MPISNYMRSLRAIVGSQLLILPGVAAIIRNNHGQILLQSSAESGLWGLPAGGIEPGESPDEAVARETAEETGLIVTNARLVAALGGEKFRVKYPNGDEVEYTVCVFECEVVNYNTLAAVDGEVSAFRWTEPEEVSTLLHMPYPPKLFVCE